MTHNNMTVKLRNLEVFTPQLDGWRQYVFITSSLIISAVAYVVQRAVYRTLKRLGSRHINQIIIPSLVSSLKIGIVKQSIRKGFLDFLKKKSGI